jgi:hypothetical protein
MGGATQSLGLTVPAVGEYEAKVWLEDAAIPGIGQSGGNQTAENAVSARLRFDNIAPHDVVIDPVDPNDPTRVAVTVSDVGSGVGGGAIEIRPAGGQTWMSVPGHVEDDKLVATIPDRKLKRGSYELRAVGADKAGNTAIGTNRSDGNPASFQIPLRVPMTLDAGFPKRVRVRAGGSARRRTRTVTKLRSFRRVRYGKAATIVGYVRAEEGRKPIAGAPVDVLATPRRSGAQAFREATVRTDENGKFKYRAEPGHSRLLTFDYPGTKILGGADDSVRLRVPAATTFRASKRFARNGETVRFAGRLRGKPYPPEGKLIALEVYLRSRWRTFANVKTRPTGTWGYRYRFDGTRGRVRYRFRARIVREPAIYPFERGFSRTRDVIVRG